MKPSSHLWAVVLAAGEGSRVRGLSRDHLGRPAPKQFCAFGRSQTLLAATLERLDGVVPPSRTVVVVAEQHRTWWEGELAAHPAANVIVQPENKGTAVGLLLPVLHVLLKRDPHARFVVLPSDHHVEDEDVLRAAFVDAVEGTRAGEGRVVLLGMEPMEEDLEGEYGWILPARSVDADRMAVACFVEKPAPDTALRLRDRGALVNSFILAADGGALLQLYERQLPVSLLHLRGALREGALPSDLRRAYDHLACADFSRDVLEASTVALDVVAVPPCGWSDLGTPRRLSAFLGAATAA